MTNPDLTALANELDDIETDAAGKCNWSEVATVSDALRRLASSDGGVKVRELEWGPYPNPVLACDDVAVADITAFGGHKYQVQRDPNAAGYIAFLAPQFGSLFWESKGHATLDAAKAAAQADYEARIRSALVEVPAVKGEPEPVASERISQLAADLVVSGWTAGDHGIELAKSRAERKLLEFACDEIERHMRSHTAPPADAGMREALERLKQGIRDIAQACVDGRVCDDVAWFTEIPAETLFDKCCNLLGEDLPTGQPALTAPGATTKSDGGQPIHAVKMPEYHYQELDMSGDHHGVTSNYSEYTPVTVRGSTSDPSSTRSEVTALADIATERQRQREVEGWTPAHDDGHDTGEMAGAAACYALSTIKHWAKDQVIKLIWPWADEWWKPKDTRRNLVKAGALIVAEIERLDRLEGPRP